MSQDIVKVDNTALMVKAEIDSQVTTAKAYPRDLAISVKKAMSTACFNQAIAQACMYTKPVGKSDTVTGASIRLAEIMIAAWGNIHCSTRLVRNDSKFISIEAIVIDRENNLIYSETVERSIMTSAKNGQTPRQYSYDMIQNTSAAGASIALRRAAFRLFGKAYVDLIYEATRQVATGKKQSVLNDSETFEVTREKKIRLFQKSGIEPEKIFAYFEVNSIEEITPENLEIIIGIQNNIKEGDLKKEEAFNKTFNNDTGEVIPNKADEINDKLPTLEEGLPLPY
jgi:hypothetical protein